MSNPNPLVPQGSLLEQQARSKSTFQMAAFIVALHVVVLGGFLFLGCKKEETPSHSPTTDTFASPASVLNEPVTNTSPTDVLNAATNLTPPAPAGGSPYTIPAVQPVVQPAIEPLLSGPGSSPAAGGSEHVVQKGDVAYVLAKKNGVTLKQMQEANAGKDLAKLKVGDKIAIPAGVTPSAAHSTPAASATPVAPSPGASGATYTVKGGDNLSRIAKKHGVTVKAIREANGMTSNDIKAGQKLKLPAKSGASAAALEPATLAPSSTIPAPVVAPANPVTTPDAAGTGTPR